MAIFYGYNPPFVGGLEGVLSRQEDVRLVQNDVLQLLLTVPGERVHEPDYGTLLRATPFEPFDEATLAPLRTGIIAAIKAEEPRMLDPEVFFEEDKDNNLVRVKITGTLSFDPNTQLLVETAVPLGTTQ